MPKISIITPTHNRLRQLKQMLSALENQDIPSDTFEVIVVSDGSTDGTDEYLYSWKAPFQLITISQANQGPAAARNCGLMHAKGEIILFIDDDVVPTGQLISEHLDYHEKYGHKIVVIGPMLNPPGYNMSPWVQWEQTMLVKQYKDMISGVWVPTARQFYTGNTSLARRHLVAAGGFNPSFRRAEDVELAYRLVALGLKFLFNPQAVGYHYAERSFNSWINIPYIYGVNDVIFSIHHGQEWLLPVIFQEFQCRNRFIKLLIEVCLGRQIFSRVVISGLKIAAQISNILNQDQPSILACSGIFNLRYFQGIADQLGGRNKFFASLKNNYV